MERLEVYKFPALPPPLVLAWWLHSFPRRLLSNVLGLLMHRYHPSRDSCTVRQHGSQ
uniref:Candidate secreted effector n=1 Tax=Meloidogyne incognita TaxID=6306 RepID=A0A914M230_MELIC